MITKQYIDKLRKSNPSLRIFVAKPPDQVKPLNYYNLELITIDEFSTITQEQWQKIEVIK